MCYKLHAQLAAESACLTDDWSIYERTPHELTLAAGVDAKVLSAGARPLSACGAHCTPAAEQKRCLTMVKARIDNAAALASGSSHSLHAIRNGMVVSATQKEALSRCIDWPTLTWSDRLAAAEKLKTEGDCCMVGLTAARGWANCCVRGRVAPACGAHCTWCSLQESNLLNTS